MVKVVFLGFGSVIQDVVKLLKKNVWSEIILDEITIVGASDSKGNEKTKLHQVKESLGCFYKKKRTFNEKETKSLWRIVFFSVFFF